MLKLEIERRKWGEYFFFPPPPPFPSFTLAPTLTVTIFTLFSSSSITTSKTAVTTVRTQKKQLSPAQNTPALQANFPPAIYSMEGNAVSEIRENFACEIRNPENFCCGNRNRELWNP